MSTPAQIEANRTNAQLSTGPRTAEGKSRSSVNARSHGITARELIIRDDERDEFDEFQDSMLQDLLPMGAMELDLFGQILHASWNMRRCRRLEAELFHGGADPLTDPELAKSLDRFARYHARYERTYHRALKELRTLQTARIVTTDLQNLCILTEEQASYLPVTVHPDQATKRTQSACSNAAKARESAMIAWVNGARKTPAAR